MIDIKTYHSNLVLVTLPTSITPQDLQQVAAKIDKLIDEHQMLRVVVDAREFSGWLSLNALKSHFRFAARQQYYVHAVAVIVERFWQRAIINTIRYFAKPQIQVFHKEDEAMQWIEDFQ